MRPRASLGPRQPKALEDGENMDTIYLDFSKAFDICDHGIIFHKLKSLGVKGKVGRWLFSFLTGRFLQVLVNGRKSSKSKLLSGVPQGSVLGPILFLIYIADIAGDIEANTLVDVDDTKVNRRVKNPAYGRQSISRPMRIIAPIPQ